MVVCGWLHGCSVAGLRVCVVVCRCVCLCVCVCVVGRLCVRLGVVWVSVCM